MADQFIPPPKSDLEASTEQGLAMLARVGEGGFENYEIEGIVSILAVQFPDIPAATLGRVVMSAAMSAGALAAARAAVPWAGPLDASEVIHLLAASAGRLIGQEEAPRG